MWRLSATNVFPHPAEPGAVFLPRSGRAWAKVPVMTRPRILVALGAVLAFALGPSACTDAGTPAASSGGGKSAEGGSGGANGQPATGGGGSAGQAGADPGPGPSGGSAGAGGGSGGAAGGADPGGGALAGAGGAGVDVDAGAGGAPGTPEDAGGAGSSEAGGGSAPDAVAANPPGAVVWNIDNLDSIGGKAVEVVGNPTVVDTPVGKGLAFDGEGDALFVEKHPLAGWGRFTVEIVFRPDGDGAFAQRFFHMSEGPGDNRVLFETRVMGGRWFLDVVVSSSRGSALVYKEDLLHPTDKFYAVAAVYDGKQVRSYVDGVLQTSGNVVFDPPRSGRTSIGVRINNRYFFKGVIQKARFTPEALTPEQLLRVTP